VVAAEHRGENDQEEDWRDESEELRLAVAGKGQQIEAKLMQNEPRQSA
jgi:hypothetical protein